MSDLEHLEIDPGGGYESDREDYDSDPATRRSRPPWIWIGIAVLAVAAIAWWFLRTPPAPDDELSAPTPELSAPARPDQDSAPRQSRFSGELPELNLSDEVVREIVASLSSHPKILTWLARPELIRTFVVSVENIAGGEAPTSHLGFLAPAGAFSTRQEDRTLRIGDESYARYDLITTAFTSLDPEGTAEAYQHLRPLLEEAFADLGYPGETFESTLRQALQNILAIQVPAEAPAVEPGVTTYSFRDPRLESASGLEKQMIRMGPENARRVQTQARRLAEALKLGV